MNLVISNISHFYWTDRLHCGKEWVNMEGLGWYDNTARFHDAILCRFTTPDPLAEQYPDLSPYSHCANNPLTIVDPDGRDWIFAEATAEYSWRDDINATSKIPQGFQYVGATNNDIINHIGLNYKFQQLESNKLGMVASDAELGYYAVSHLVNVRAKTMVEIVANVTFEPNNRTDQNLSGRTFNGITIEVSQVTSNSPIDGEVVTGGKVTFDYGNATYSGYLGLPKKPVLHSSETSVKAASIDIPKNKLSTEYTLKKIQVSGNWFVSTPGGYTPIVYHSLMPIPLSYTHTWKLKK